MKKLLSLLLALLLAFSAALPILAVEAEGDGEEITYPSLTEDDYNALYVEDGLAMAADFFRMNGYWNTDGTVYTVPVGPSLNKAYEYDVDGDGEKEVYDLTKAETRNITVTIETKVLGFTVKTETKRLYEIASSEWRSAYKDWMNAFVWTYTGNDSMRFAVYGNTTNEAKEFAPVNAAAGYLQFRDDYHTSGGVVFTYVPGGKTASNELVISFDKFSSNTAPNLFYNIRPVVSATEANGVKFVSYSNTVLGGEYYIKKTVGTETTEVSAHDTQALARAAMVTAAEGYAAELQAAVIPTEGVTVTFTARKDTDDKYTLVKTTVKGTAQPATEEIAVFAVASRQNPAYALVHNPSMSISLNTTFTLSQSIALKDGNDDYSIRTQNGTVFSSSAPYNGAASSLNSTNYIGWGTAQSHMKMYAYRHYTRVLSNADIVQNHFADLCKWFRLDVTSLYDANGLCASDAEIAFLAAYLVKYTFEDDREAVADALAEALDAWSFEGEGEAFEAFVAAIEAGKIDGKGVRALPESYRDTVYTAYKAFVDANAGADNDALQGAVDTAVAAVLAANYADYYEKTPALTAESFFATEVQLSDAALHFSAIAEENNLDMSVLSPVAPVIRERIYETFYDLHLGVYYHSAILQARLADITAELVEYYFGDGLVDDVAAFLGYQIRLYGAQSFRAVFEIDREIIALLEEHGYKVTVGLLRRDVTDTALEVENTEDGWVAVTPQNANLSKATQVVIYETDGAYAEGCFEKDGAYLYAYEVTPSGTTKRIFLRGYVVIEREGNEDTVFYCETDTENFDKGPNIKDIAEVCKENYGIVSANIQALTPNKKRVVQPVVFIGGENLSLFKAVTDEATAAVAEGFIAAFKNATGATMQTVSAADCTATDTGLITFVAGDTASIKLVGGSIVFTYTGDGEAALAAFAALLAAPEAGYDTFAYGDEEPWPVCLLATESDLTPSSAE